MAKTDIFLDLTLRKLKNLFAKVYLSNSQLGGDVGGRGTCAATRGRAARRVRGLARLTKPIALLGPLDRWPVTVRVTVEVPVATVARAQRALVLPATAGDAHAGQRRG